MAVVVKHHAEVARARRTSWNRHWIQRVVPWIVPIGLIIAWQSAVQLGLIASRILPAPLDVVRVTLEMFARDHLANHIAVSARRAFSGLLVGGGIGFIVGLLNGMFPFSERLLDSSVQMIRNIPHLALMPLVIVWFGIGEPARLFLVSLGVFFPLYLNTYHGVRAVDGGLREMGAVYGLSSWALFRHVIFPGALPSILVGLRYGLGIMWLTLIVGESLSSNVGIGHLTMNAREFMQTDVLVMGIVIYALLGKLADSVARALERRLLRWQPRVQDS
jgi:sulfonate transport system permease protein